MVRDNYKGLIWQGCAAGQSGDNCTTGTAHTMSWWAAADDDDASQDPLGDDYCRTLDWGGYNSGWRLPTQTSADKATGELSFILVEPCPVNSAIGNACIDNVAFPNTPAGLAGRFWSSSIYASYPSSVWVVNFGTGHVYNADKAFPGYVRCVRGP